MSDPLATVDQLAAYLGADRATAYPDGSPAAAKAELALAAASAAVRGFLQCDVSRRDGIVEVCDPDPRGFVILTRWPVIRVDKIETLLPSGWWDDEDTVDEWTDITTRCRVSLTAGIVYASRLIAWPRLPGSWRVTYSAGFDPVPDEVALVVAQLAGDQVSTEPGVDSETLGNYSIKYASSSRGTDLSAQQAAILAPYRNPVIG